MVALTWGGANQVGTWTFLVLWVMRLSAKLNVFLGVPNLTDEFLPEHLRYLKSFLARTADEPAVPGLGDRSARRRGAARDRAAAAPAAGAFEAAGFTFVAALLALAILEHWFLVLPLPDAALWRWALRSPRAGTTGATGRRPFCEPEPMRALSAIGRRP